VGAQESQALRPVQPRQSLGQRLHKFKPSSWAAHLYLTLEITHTWSVNESLEREEKKNNLSFTVDYLISLYLYVCWYRLLLERIKIQAKSTGFAGERWSVTGLWSPQLTAPTTGARF
jgi:hypothetical protein